MPVLGILSIAGLVACGSREVPGTGSAAAPPSPQAITVERPLDIDKYVADPCQSLSADQRTRFAATDAGHPRLSAGLPSCDWNFGTTGDVMANIAYDPYHQGLAGIDELHRARNPVDYYIPTEIEGYPAAYNSFGDGRPLGSCDLSVATARTALFTVSFNSRAGDDGCTAAKNLATAVVQTIRTGG